MWGEGGVEVMGARKNDEEEKTEALEAACGSATRGTWWSARKGVSAAAIVSRTIQRFCRLSRPPNTPAMLVSWFSSCEAGSKVGAKRVVRVGRREGWG